MVYKLKSRGDLHLTEFPSRSTMSASLSLALLALFAVSASAVDSQGWINVGGRFLKFFAEPKTFAEADGVCTGLGGLIVYDDHPTITAFLARSREFRVRI